MDWEETSKQSYKKGRVITNGIADDFLVGQLFPDSSNSVTQWKANLMNDQLFNDQFSILKYNKQSLFP